MSFFLNLFRLLPDRPNATVPAARCTFACHSSRFLVYSRCSCDRDPTLTNVALPWHTRLRGRGAAMTFEEILDQALAMLQRRRRVAYRTLQVQFNLDDNALEALKDELLYAQQVARDEDGRVLVWTAGAATPPSPPPRSTTHVSQPPTQEAALAQTAPRPVTPSTPEAERRQLTVMFCDLVGSTPLAEQLDPEDLREVVRAYQAACAKVITRFEGWIAQYLGDGLLVYFGYPLAHEDDPQRAVRAGLGIVEAITQLNAHLGQARDLHLAVRLGIHTGLVVVGKAGRHEQLVVGETPNLAARLQGVAEPNTMAISAATYRLLEGFFGCQALGTPALKGVSQPIEVYRVLYESAARSRLDVARSRGLTPLVGREQEVALLLERWAQVKDGVGQVVLLSGEAGIGKSRLVQVLTEHVATEPQAWLIPCQCSPYHQNSALYPVIDLLERVVLQFEPEASPHQKLDKVEGFLVQYGLSLPEAVPLFAALLSIPLSSRYAPLNISPEQHRQRTLHALLTILWRRAAQQPVLCVVEDLHWVDPSTLELLTLLVDQGPTARILTLFTYRPDFSPPWTGRSHLTQVMLHRLTRRQVTEMMSRVAHGKALPPEVVEQVVAKTDGVPLFVEELTKMVLESGLLQEREDRYALTGPLPPLAIPATLQDSLTARLDRLAMVKGVAQLGATLGREFTYALLQAISPVDATALQQALGQLVAAELLYQRGVPPQATYRFKHALIQEAAYQSLLRSTRQRSHQRIAQVLEACFPKSCETQPELLAHHYTEAGLMAQAIPYWQRAGQRAIERSANLEAIGHLTRGLEVLETLPDTPERAQQELTLQTALGLPLLATKGFAAPEVERVYGRARELCRQVGQTPQLFPVLHGLWRFYVNRAEFQTARELAEQLLILAQRQQDPGLLLEAHRVLGQTTFWLGEMASTREHMEQGMALYDFQQHRSHTFLYGQDPGVVCRSFAAWALWVLGYADQACQRIQEALTLAQELAHPFSLAYALTCAAIVHSFRREGQATHRRAEEVIELSREQGFPFWFTWGTILRGWAFAEHGQGAEGIAQMQQGLAAYQATGADVFRPSFLALLGEAYGKEGQAEAGLCVLIKALAVVNNTDERWWEAELYRLKGELLSPSSMENWAEAETCFRQAIDVARRQQAKSLELRAAMSLSRLWQQQGKRAEARQLLAPIYNWFTEGFETADLQEAKALLAELQ
jgi:TOMM system kinase/cyclase fusion protein